MPQLGIEVTADERTRIKLACVARKETITDVGRRLLLAYVGGEDVEKPILDLCIEVANYLNDQDRTFEDGAYAMRLRRAVQAQRARAGKGET